MAACATGDHRLAIDNAALKPALRAPMPSISPKFLLKLNELCRLTGVFSRCNNPFGDDL
jgi:hypothetical protein